MATAKKKGASDVPKNGAEVLYRHIPNGRTKAETLTARVLKSRADGRLDLRVHHGPRTTIETEIPRYDPEGDLDARTWQLPAEADVEGDEGEGADADADSGAGGGDAGS